MGEAGIVDDAQNGLYTLTYASAELAAHFLFVENMVHFRSGCEKEDGSLRSVECMFLQAGLHDIIMVDFAADKVDISAISSFAMIDSIKALMTTPPDF
jgi:hypothetical protein